MTRRHLLSWIALGSLVYGIELSVAPDRNTTPPSPAEVEALSGYYYKYFKIRIAPEGVKRLVRENRALANAYLERYGLDPQIQERLRVVGEFLLANEMVERMQRSVQIPKEVVHSYYLDHLDRFKREDRVKLYSFLFPTPEDAIAFYLQNKGESSLEKLKKAAKEHSFTIFRDYKETPVKALDPFLKANIKEGQGSYLLPPRLSSQYEVFYVQSYTKGQGYKPFEEVREEIERELRQKRYLQDRKRILSSLEQER